MQYWHPTGFDYGGVSFHVDVSLALSPTLNEAVMSVWVMTGLPSLLGNTLQGAPTSS